MPPNEQTPLLTTVVVTPRRERYSHSTLRRFCTISLSATLIIVVILFLLPVSWLPPHSEYHEHRRWSFPWSSPVPGRSWPRSEGLSYGELQKVLLESPSETKVREWSQYYTSGPHLAGKNLTQALWTRERWQEFGVQDSNIVAYDIYMNYPISHRLALLQNTSESVGNSAEAWVPSGFEVKYECKLEEDILEKDPTTSLDSRIPTFHGYSASGNVTAQYVYVNFGTFEDFEDLVKAEIALAGKIAVAKYGKIFRGLKIKRAQELGMVGVVMYTDPQEDGEMTEENGYKTYPDGPARNPSSVQRGSTQFLSTQRSQPSYGLSSRCANCLARFCARRSNYNWLSVKARSSQARSARFHPSYPVCPDLLRGRSSNPTVLERPRSSRLFVQQILARRRVGL